MATATHEVSIKGKIHQLPALRLDDVMIITKGNYLHVAEIFDEYWLPVERLPDPHRVLAELQTVECQPDLFTFAQRVPDTEPRFPFHMELDNVAVIPLSSYDEWFGKQISSASRRNIRASEKKGVIVKEVSFDDEYVRGIMSIYDESPIRAGRKFWHFGKDFRHVQSENGTYRERSIFLAAYAEGEMIGYLKVVLDVKSAAIMQILSKLKFRERRPNNALLAQAVRICAEKKIPHLLYESYVYGHKEDSSLTRFKRENGFVRMDLPRYFVPLTHKGSLCLKLGLHRDMKDRVPYWLRSRFVRIRDDWYARRGMKE
jgi:hypothetical protein